MTIQKAWPPTRETDVLNIPGSKNIIRPRIKLSEFKKAVSPIFKWSFDRKCRHYVKIYDRTKTKFAFKNKLLTIEWYFYKLLS